LNNYFLHVSNLLKQSRLKWSNPTKGECAKEKEGDQRAVLDLDQAVVPDQDLAVAHKGQDQAVDQGRDQTRVQRDQDLARVQKDLEVVLEEDRKAVLDPDLVVDLAQDLVWIHKDLDPDQVWINKALDRDMACGQ